MEELSILYKVIVLSILYYSKAPLSGDLISNFFTENDYTDYISGQDALGTLIEAGLIEQKKDHLFYLTGLGADTRNILKDRINKDTQSDITDYLKKNDISLNQHNDITAYFEKSKDGGFLCFLKYRSDDAVLLDMTLRAENKIQAENICLNFKARYEDIYFNNIESLTD